MTKVDKNITSDLTIVVPTFNRSDHLKRLLNYYSKYSLDYSVLVLDSSHSEASQINESFINTLRDNFTYMNFDPDISVAMKLHKGLENVTSNYCVLCADDDILFIDGLIEAVNFLEENPGYVCVDGIYLNFTSSNKDINLTIEYSSYGINLNHPCARVFRHMQRYESLFYGVFRAVDLVRIFRYVSKISTLHFQELFQSNAALMLGKSHRINCFYAARQNCSPAEPGRDKWQTYYWFAENRAEILSYYCDYRKLLLEFYRSYVNEPTLSEEDFERVMDLSHATFFGINCPPSYFYDQLISLWPEDPYVDTSDDNENICNQLKSKLRLTIEGWSSNLFEQLKKRRLEKGSKLYMFWYRKSLLQEAPGSWNCLLEQELAWLVSVPKFRRAWATLCIYLNG